VPKGADLHQHLSGSVYAETMLEWGRADGNCINNTSLAAVARSGRTIVGFDLCEVAPGPDGNEWDGNVGARLLYKMVGATLRSRGET
jgi:hypothetical protein